MLTTIKYLFQKKGPFAEKGNLLQKRGCFADSFNI